MSKIFKIPSSRWHTLEKIFLEEFDSDLPDPKFAEIYGEYENGKLKGFVLTEKIVMCGQIYVMPEFRAESNGQTARKLVNYLVETLPDGIAVGAVASEKRFEALYRILKMQKIPGTFFRRNL